MTALDEIKSIEGLILFENEDPNTSEKFYNRLLKENNMACRAKKANARRVRGPAPKKPKAGKKK